MSAEIVLDVSSQKSIKAAFDVNYFDNLLNPETLVNPQILDLMDDTLSMDLMDLIKLLEFFNYTISKDSLVEIINQSKFYIFDEKFLKIKLRNRPQRRTIVFPNYEFPEDIQDFLKNKLQCEDKIDRIERLSSGIIFVFFNTEENTSEVFKRLEKFKFDNNVEIYASVRSECLKRKIMEKMEIKIKEQEIEKMNSLYFRGHIISDLMHYLPRKLEGEKSMKSFDFKRRSYSFYETDSKFLGNLNTLNNNSNNDTSSQTSKRKSSGNNFRKDVRSSIKNYYNKYNLTFDPEKYIRNNLKNGITQRRSMILDLDIIPEKKTQSNIKFKYSFENIVNIFNSLKNLNHTKIERFVKPIMTLIPKTILNHFTERKEKRLRSFTFNGEPMLDNDFYNSNSSLNNNNIKSRSIKLNNNNNNKNLQFNLYAPLRRRTESYNVIN